MLHVKVRRNDGVQGEALYSSGYQRRLFKKNDSNIYDPTESASGWEKRLSGYKKRGRQEINDTGVPIYQKAGRQEGIMEEKAQYVDETLSEFFIRNELGSLLGAINEGGYFNNKLADFLVLEEYQRILAKR